MQLTNHFVIFLRLGHCI